MPRFYVKNKFFNVNYKNSSIPGFIIGLLFIFGIVAGMFWLITALLAWAWAITLVPIFGLPAITKLQAFGLIVILGFIGSIFKSKE